MNVLILGTGSIAKGMALTINDLKDKNIVLYGVASRDKKRADEFKKNYHALHSFSSYQEALECKDVDLVYIATPHVSHYQNTKDCLLNNKAVLCEKPFTINSKQLKELIILSKEKNLLLVEAFWTRFMPFVNTVKEIINNNQIGKIKVIKSTFGYDLRDVERLTNLSLGGGALLDVGVYALNMAFMFLGEDFKIEKAKCKLYKTGVDAHDEITLSYKNKAKAKLITGMDRKYSNNTYIKGDKGKIIIKNTNNPNRIILKKKFQLKGKEIQIKPQVSGYEYELYACLKALENHQIECEQVSHQTSLKMMETLDELRRIWKIKYPCE